MLSDDALARVRAAIERIERTGWRIWAESDALCLSTQHTDVESGQPREFYWRKAWPFPVRWIAEDSRADPYTLADHLAMMVYEEMVREAAHEVAETLLNRGRYVVDPHPGGELAAGDGTGAARVYVEFD